MLRRELIASAYMSAGDVAPRRSSGLSAIDVRTRVELVAATGWSGMGLGYADLVRARDQVGLAELASMLSDCGIGELELEVIRDWWTSGARRLASDRVRHDLFEAAPQLGVRAIKVVAHNGGEPVDRERLLGEFDRLATEAGTVGTRVALEPMRSSDVVPTIEAAVDIVATVGNPCGGLVVDCYHTVRGGTPYSELPHLLPLDSVFIVELSDGNPEIAGTFLDGEIDQRRLPGEGVFDVPAFVVAMHHLGYAGRWGVEVLSEEYRALPVATGLERAHRSAVEVLAEAERALAARAEP